MTKVSVLEPTNHQNSLEALSQHTSLFPLIVCVYLIHSLGGHPPRGGGVSMKISGNKRFLRKLVGISEIRKAAAGGKF